MTKPLHLTFLLSALAANPAMAQAVAGADRVITVATADLHLATTAGQRALDRRLANAVVEACGVESAVDLAGSNDILRCRADTSARIAADRDRLVALASKGSDIFLASR